MHRYVDSKSDRNRKNVQLFADTQIENTNSQLDTSRSFGTCKLLATENKKLSCRREAARCFVSVSSQLQHTYSAVFYY